MKTKTYLARKRVLYGEDFLSLFFYFLFFWYDENKSEFNEQKKMWW